MLAMVTGVISTSDSDIGFKSLISSSKNLLLNLPYIYHFLMELYYTFN